MKITLTHAWIDFNLKNDNFMTQGPNNTMSGNSKLQKRCGLIASHQKDQKGP